jgi:hypothetical protein
MLFEMQNLLKYEGKTQFSGCLDKLKQRGHEGSTSPLSSRFGSVKALLILGNQFFSNMFTSYSHALAFLPLPLA